jgi:hypothetical protein
MNKKGDIFNEELVKVVLSVFGILILFSLGMALSGIFTQDREILKATKVLEEITTNVNILNKGESKNLIVEGPENWWISAWPYNDEELMPQKCEGRNCLCVCKDPLFATKESVVDSCNEKGVCETFDFPMKTYLESNEGISGEIGKKLSAIFGLDLRNSPIIIKGVRNIIILRESDGVVIKL